MIPFRTSRGGCRFDSKELLEHCPVFLEAGQFDEFRRRAP